MPHSNSLILLNWLSEPMLPRYIATLPLMKRFGAPAMTCCSCAAVGAICNLFAASAQYCRASATAGSSRAINWVIHPLVSQSLLNHQPPCVQPVKKPRPSGIFVPNWIVRPFWVTVSALAVSRYFSQVQLASFQSLGGYG